jgi:1,4-alpha-glucan branching enzyme
MNIIVHHRPISPELPCNLYAWQLAWNGNALWDSPSQAQASGVLDFAFPNVSDPRLIPFKFHSVNDWEPDDFIRQVVQINTPEIWTFGLTARILQQNPNPPGVNFAPGAVLTFNLITQSRFAGGRLYAWNPYVANGPSIYFNETSRNTATGVSTFAVPLSSWMTSGFHLKFTANDANGDQVWEPDSAIRVWRPCDGDTLWLKSGQCDVRSQQFNLTSVPLTVMLPANLATVPAMTLTDVAEDETFSFNPTNVQPLAGTPFQLATYAPTVYPQAAYTIQADSGESAAIVRPFPADPADTTAMSTCVLGTSAWFAGVPQISQSVTVVVEPRPAASSFTKGLSIQVSTGNAVPYATEPAVFSPGQGWTAALTVAQNTLTSLALVPANGIEPTPYASPYQSWIDIRRMFTPPSAPTTVYTTEGVYGVTTKGPTLFAEPVGGRPPLMQAAFGNAIVASGIFGAQEMPLGALITPNGVSFVVHAPHAAWAALVLVDETAPGGPARQIIPMSLTGDTLYWWCLVPLAQAPAGSRYHFLFNDDLETLDPAAREVVDAGNFKVSVGSDPQDLKTPWSLVIDVAAVNATAHAQPWQTMGWQNLLVYEMHVERFTDLAPGGLLPFDLLVDELKPVSRLNQPGYLHALPVTAFELLPVQEFNNTISWGYDPTFYFAIDKNYGGSAAFARFVNAAHQNGRAVLLDVVYNHSLGSPLMQIAPDVYTNGNYDGDRMNCGHPMVGEYFRQASVHLLHNFGVDGFRFDDTNTIINKCPGGWDFLGNIRWAIHTAATAEGRAWPYCVAENSGTQPWDVSNPGYGVMDGQWGTDESYRIRDATYDISPPPPNQSAPWGDDASRVKAEMDNPAYQGRPFNQAVRFGESHDMVSAQNSLNQRIAARPRPGLGLQAAKAFGALTLLSNGIPMLFMGQEAGETTPFVFDSASATALNPQKYALSASATNQFAQVLGWFRQLMSLRNDPNQGLQGGSNYQVIGVGIRTVAYTCGAGQGLFVVVTFGTPNQNQDSSWLGLPGGGAFKEIFNSSWPSFQVESEPECSNGGYDARISSGQILNLPFMGAVVLQRAY